MLANDAERSGAPRLAAAAAALVVRAYQVAVSPLLGPTCRFAPSCSQYARQALRRHGMTRGSWMALRRVLRCHPWHPGGWDPVA